MFQRDDERLEGRFWYPTPPSAVGGERSPGAAPTRCHCRVNEPGLR